MEKVENCPSLCDLSCCLEHYCWRSLLSDQNKLHNSSNLRCQGTAQILLEVAILGCCPEVNRLKFWLIPMKINQKFWSSINMSLFITAMSIDLSSAVARKLWSRG